ncbi:bifunctional rhamnulose-1-phosphate aldolase/short-chain dehydrogenase [Paenibacillus montanisoli]|uniref:Bifunctional rhamnulose-1-phosphate aldolase/short-chain dehydrogenase n=1 Tax=Paenibacillus montanisoli TaxID=2081970 RepID=A0A328U8U3_9BACL|nr:bifunctional rhamnulose-1-phosphate aldolase/short-chain dehydrogenase [Paenibacillus montanisoli]RAP76574.1 bifunctional rhamnulose-1-phosphate aldolase/short-chain dehydrogenase [Paenibacillus montanisoli]
MQPTVWNGGETVLDEEMELLVRVSRRLGSDERLVLAGGGNTSLKRMERDLLGREHHVLRVKASGFRLASIASSGFSGVKLDELAPLQARDTMTDEDMVNYIAHTMTAPDQPRPSIETLLHAWIPYRWVLHTHADDILSTANSRLSMSALQDIYGDRLLVIPYERPGFLLSKQVWEAVSSAPEAEGLLLLHHGLVTWGDDCETAYERHMRFVARAQAYIARQEQPVSFAPREPESRKLAEQVTPVLRGALKLSSKDAVMLSYDDSPEIIAFTRRRDLSALLTAMPATPEHLLALKPFALVIPALPPAEEKEALKIAISDAVSAFREEYAAYIRRNGGNPAESHHPSPRIIAIPGLGVWASGPTAPQADYAMKVFRHTIGIMEKADAAGGYSPLAESEMFQAEYWPLELYKLKAPRERKGELYGKIAMVTGGAKGIGLSIARLMLEEDACVILADIDRKSLAEAESEMNSLYTGRIRTLHMDVTDEASVENAFAEASLFFGGLDILVSNAGVAPVGSVQTLSLRDWERSFAVNATGHFLVARTAVRTMLAQGHGGSIVFINTKNVPAPGKDFGAYSCAKAAEAQLCRILAIEHGPDRIRSNMINPDTIFTDLWTPDMKENRAQAYGVPVDQFESYIRNRSLMKETVTAEDVAQAALYLASDRSRVTTGCILSVDAGAREAFPR